MSWSEIIKILAGPIIGAFIALVAIWLKGFLDKRKSVQSWFEQHYIIEGVDLLISHFIVLESFIIGQRLGKLVGSEHKSSKSIENLSSEIIAKLEAILQSRIFIVSASFIKFTVLTEFKDKSFEERALNECLNLAKRYNSILSDLRKELLKVKLKALGPLNWIRDHQENQCGCIEFSKFHTKKGADQERPEP